MKFENNNNDIMNFQLINDKLICEKNELISIKNELEEKITNLNIV